MTRFAALSMRIGGLATAMFAGWMMPGCRGGSDGGMKQDGPRAKVQMISSAAEMKSRLADDSVLVVHTLEKQDYLKEHIPGSVHISYKDVSETTLRRPKDAPVVFYCAGGGCPVGRMAADRAVSAGYTNVYVFEGGVKDWKAAGYALAAGE